MVINQYSIFDNMIEGVQIVDHAFRYLYVNNTVVKHGKSSRESLLGNTMMEQYPGIEQTEMFQLLTKCLQAAEPQQMINKFDFPDGSVGYFELRIQPLEEGALIMSFDITDQKKAEQLIQSYNVELEKEVGQRTEELKLQQKVIQQQLLSLEELNATKNKFFSIVAHDLRSPLSSLKSFSTVLIECIDELSKQEIVMMGEQLQQSVDNTIKMADNLITWARIQMNEYESVVENCRVRTIVDNIEAVYSPLVEKKEINYSCELDDDLMVRGDSNQIEFIMRNLVSNAIKFTHPQGSIRLKGAVQNDEMVKLSVTDTGVGVTNALKEQLFSFRMSSSTLGTSGEKGTGLGLMLSQEFARLNGGHIAIDSKEGEGSSFQLYLKNGALAS